MQPLILRARATRPIAGIYKRHVSTLLSNPNIYVFPATGSSSSSNILSLLPSDPPTPELAIGTTTAIPPTPDSLSENPNFLNILQSVLRIHAHRDRDVILQAKAFASTAGSSFRSGGAFFPQQQKARRQSSGGGSASGDGAGGGSAQGGAGGAGRSGWVHLSDRRNPPDYGRIAWPEDIFGSLQVDGEGNFVGETGEYQPSGTYRVVTKEGILGLSQSLLSKVLERLEQEEKAIKQSLR